MAPSSVSIQVFAVVVALLIASCSDSGTLGETSPSTAGSTTGQPEIDIEALGEDMGRRLFDNQPPGDERITEDEAACIGFEFFSGLVDEVGSQALVEAGFTDSLESLGDVIDNEQFDMLYLYGLEECTTLLEQMALELGANAGWSDQSALCFFDGLLADSTTRPLIAWAIGTAGSLGPAFETMDPRTAFNQMFDCLDEVELTQMVIQIQAPVDGVSEAGLVCLLEGVLADEATRETFREAVEQEPDAESVAFPLRRAFENQQTSGPMGTLAGTCLSDDERSALFGP